MSEVNAGTANSNSNPSPQSGEERWQCKLCTYLNSAALRYCHTCQGWRFEHIFNEGTPCSPSSGALDYNSVQLPSPSSSIPLFLLPSLSDSSSATFSPSPSPSPSRNYSPDVRSPLATSSHFFTSTSLTSVSTCCSPALQRAYSPPPPLPPTDLLESVAESLSDRCPKPDPGLPLLELPWDLELLYDRGRTLLMKISVRRNAKKAWELLQLAANKGHPAAQWDLALRKPESDEIDWDRAVEFYVMQMQTGTALGGNDTVDRFDKGAIAAFCLGCCFLGGWGVERREDRAVALYKIAVRRGYLKGLNEVGWIYDHGLGGVVQDSASAFQCFKLLARRGYALAQYNTGRCYRDGRGVNVDWREAIEWLIRASEQGYHNAQRSLGSMFQVGDGGQYSTSQVLNAASANNTSPTTNASALPAGIQQNPTTTTAAVKATKSKVKKDVVRAMILYRDSASNGDPAGVHKIQEMTSNTRVTYRGSGVFKEPVSYFMEVKLRQRKLRQLTRNQLKRSRGEETKEENAKHQPQLLEQNKSASTGLPSPTPSTPSTPSTPTNPPNSGGATTKKEEEKKGEYWVPKLVDQCCLVLSKGDRAVWEDANIPISIKTKLDREALQCSAGCGGVFYGKGRVTRSFVYMKLVHNNSNKLNEGKLRGDVEYYVGTWRDFGANSETTAVWRDTGKVVTMHFCSGPCAEGFLQRSYWDF